MNRPEKLFIKAIKTILNESLELPNMHDIHDVEETSHTYQFQWNTIEDEFRRLAIDSGAHYNNLCVAFFETHNVYHINDPKFGEVMVSMLKSQGVPQKYITMALDILNKIVQKYCKDTGERDIGYNPNIDEIANDTSHADNRKLKREKPFTGGGPWPDQNEIK